MHFHKSVHAAETQITFGKRVTRFTHSRPALAAPPVLADVFGLPVSRCRRLRRRDGGLVGSLGLGPADD
jgi:hypothetical protein